MRWKHHIALKSELFAHDAGGIVTTHVAGVLQTKSNQCCSVFAPSPQSASAGLVASEGVCPRPDMDLALFYLGIWLRHEKCPSCAAYYHEHFVVEDSYLQALPLDFEGQGAGRVVWGESPNHQDCGGSKGRTHCTGAPQADTGEVVTSG